MHEATADELEKLLERIALKDQSALEQLHHRVAGKLSSAAMNVLYDSDLSKDVVQETLLQIWFRAGDYQRSQSEPMTWMSAILRYRAIDRLKCEGVEKNRRDQFERFQECTETRALDTPVTHLLTQELHRQLRGGLTSLCTVNRNALVMAYYYGYSRESIAIHLNQPVNSIKACLRRDLMKLNRYLSC